MLLSAITVLVVLASGDPADGSTRAMEQALRVALGPAARIDIADPKSIPETEEALVASASEAHATLLVVVAWSDRQRRATLRVMKPSQGRWLDREIRFDAADIATERGRTVGFALASMVPADTLDTDERRAAPVVRIGSAANRPIESIDSQPSGRSSERSRDDEHFQTRHPGHPVSLETSALSVTAVQGYGGGIGGSFALRIPLAGDLAARGVPDLLLRQDHVS